MTTIGFFQNEVDPVYRVWICDKNIKYVQREVQRRLKAKYIDNVEVEYDTARVMLTSTMQKWRGPLNLYELLEMVICNFVTDIDTDIEWRNRFNHFNPRTLYFPGTDITREEKVKLNPGYKFEFQMNY